MTFWLLIWMLGSNTPNHKTLNRHLEETPVSPLPPGQTSLAFCCVLALDHPSSFGEVASSAGAPARNDFFSAAAGFLFIFFLCLTCLPLPWHGVLPTGRTSPAMLSASPSSCLLSLQLVLFLLIQICFYQVLSSSSVSPGTHEIVYWINISIK